MADNMDEYNATIKFSFDVNEDSMNKVRETLESLSDETGNVDFENIENLKALADAFKSFSKSIEIDEKKDETTDDLIQVEQVPDEIGKIGTKLIGGLEKLGSRVLTELKTIITDAWDDLGDILDYSLLSNSDVREQALTLGLSAAENYALEKTESLLGLSSLEDAYYMTAEQQEKFQEKFTEYAERYNELYDQGFFTEYQEFEWEMAEFKEDMEYEVMQFFVDNKETIETFLQLGKDAFEVATELFGLVADFISGIGEMLGLNSASTAKSADSLSSYLISNSANNTNVKQDNTFNISGTDAKIVDSIVYNTGYTSEQIITALGGR